MMLTSALAVSLWALSLQVVSGNFTSLCGDCWCVPDGGVGTGECPAFSPGIWQTFDSNWPTLYASMTLTSTPLTLQTSNGSSSCFPFFNTLGNSLTYPQSQFPACDPPTSLGTDSVCAYKYSGDNTTACSGRSYELMTYTNTSEVDADGAQLVHSGACGVCSNAQDLGTRMKTAATLSSQTVTCATAYVFDRDWTKLIGCYESLGFSDQCATMWAHFSVANFELCASVCSGSGSGVLNGDPPFCALSNCLNCSASKFESDFNTLSGIDKSAYNAGFNGNVAYPCSYFTRINDLDPCVGAVASPPGPVPTPAPAMGAGVGTSTSAANQLSWVLAKAVAVMAGAIFATV